MSSRSYSYLVECGFVETRFIEVATQLLHPTRPFPTEVSVAVDESYCAVECRFIEHVASFAPINHTDSRGIKKDAEDRRGRSVKCGTEQYIDRSDMRKEDNCLVRR